MNAEGFGQLATSEEKVFQAENETIWVMEEYSLISSVTPAIARTVMFAFGKCLIYLFIYLFIY